MRNVKKAIGEGFKHSGNLFGVSINYWSAGKFEHKDGRIAVALTKDNKVDETERVYIFANSSAFDDWRISIHEGDGHYLHYQDGGLLVRAYPCLGSNNNVDDDY